MINSDSPSNVKITKVGAYRMFFMFVVVVGLVLFGVTENLLIFTGLIAVISAWIIFEQWVVFRAVMGVQRLLIFAMQPKQENKVPKDTEGNNTILPDSVEESTNQA